MAVFRKQGGYLVIDHSNSPGLPEHVARQAGYDPKLAGEGKVFEVDTYTCPHCKSTVIKHPDRERPRALCFKCDSVMGKYICDGCAYLATLPDYIHTPFEKVVDDLKSKA